MASMDATVFPQYFQTNGEYDIRKVAVAFLPLVLLYAFLFPRVGGHGYGMIYVMILLVATVILPLVQGKKSQIFPIIVAWITGFFMYAIAGASVVPAILIGLLMFIVVELYLQAD